ncbi:MAG: hypothetical protein REI12_15080 [Pedobacter sp.]|nr:hypothetical protein [Pedobacter sp.]
MSAVEKLENAEAAVLELSLFFVRHSLPYWPAQLSPVLIALRERNGASALDAWSRLALMGENGLMQLRVNYDDGFRAADMDAEQRHFERLLQQTLDAVNNLRFYLRNGVDKPLISIYPDVAI